MAYVLLESVHFKKLQGFIKVDLFGNLNMADWSVRSGEFSFRPTATNKTIPLKGCLQDVSEDTTNCYNLNKRDLLVF